jgi:hypothetical protein
MKLNTQWMWGVVLLLAAALAVFVVVPAVVKARADACTPACRNKLRIIDAAKEQAIFARELPLDADCDDPANRAAVNQYIKGNRTPICPEGGTFRYGRATNVPTCSFFNPKDPKTFSHSLPELASWCPPPGETNAS